MSLAATLGRLLQTGPFPGRSAFAYRAIILVFAVIGTGVRIALTVDWVAQSYAVTLSMLELVAVLVLTLDLHLHAALAVLTPPAGRSRWFSLWRYFRQPQGIIDLMAVVPYFVAAVVPMPADWELVLGLLRFLKLGRYSPALETLQSVLHRQFRPLRAALFILLLLLVSTSTMLYLVERHANPTNFGTIPDAMWWSVVTLTTVGYGDAVPLTRLGKLLGGGVAILGVGMFALPASILATGFAEEVRRRDFLHTWAMVARVPFLSGLDATQIASITRLLRFLTAAPGDVLIRAGEEGDRMYFIVSGRVSVDFGHGRSAVLKDGDFFGEIALLTNSLRTATVTALTRCQLLALDAADFRQFLAGSPAAAEALSHTAQARMRELDGVVGD